MWESVIQILTYLSIITEDNNNYKKFSDLSAFKTLEEKGNSWTNLKYKYDGELQEDKFLILINPFPHIDAF